MQSPPLPVQLTATPPAPASARKQGSPSDGGQFSAALSQQMNQRQAAPAAKPQAAAKPAQPEPKQQTGADTPDSAAPATPPPATAKADGADASSEQPETADSAAAAASNPMLDLMALVASFNQPAAPIVAAPAAAAAIATDAGADAAVQAPLAALPADVAIQLPLAAAAARLAGQATPAANEGAPAEPAPVFATTMAKADGAMQQSLEAAAAKLALPQAHGTAAAAQEKSAPADTVQADAGKPPAIPMTPGGPAAPAAIQQRELVAEPVVQKEVPIAAVAATPLQQASFAPLQAAAAVQGADRIAARVGTPAWDNQVAQKIVWMVAGQEQSATLTLNPPDMGPMQVVLSVTNDQASVTFSAAQPEVRQALQDAMPKLREMMGESGIALGNASVHDGSANQQQAQGEPGRASHSAVRGDSASGSASEAEARVAARPVRAGSTPGLVDTFA